MSKPPRLAATHAEKTLGKNGWKHLWNRRVGLPSPHVPPPGPPTSCTHTQVISPPSSSKIFFQRKLSTRRAQTGKVFRIDRPVSNRSSHETFLHKGSQPSSRSLLRPPIYLRSKKLLRSMDKSMGNGPTNESNEVLFPAISPRLSTLVKHSN